MPNSRTRSTSGFVTMYFQLFPRASRLRELNTFDQGGNDSYILSEKRTCYLDALKVVLLR
jgi:hypothetical protein